MKLQMDRFKNPNRQFQAIQAFLLRSPNDVMGGACCLRFSADIGNRQVDRAQSWLFPRKSGDRQGGARI